MTEFYNNIPTIEIITKTFSNLSKPLLKRIILQIVWDPFETYKQNDYYRRKRLHDFFS